MKSIFLGLIVSTIILAPNRLADQPAATAQELDFSYPLFWPTFLVHGENTPTIFYPDDSIELGMFIKNQDKVSTNLILVTQIIAPEGFVESVQISEGTLTASNETLKLINYWKPEQANNYLVEAFLLENKTGLLQPLSEKWTTDLTVRPEHNKNILHDLRVELKVNDSNSHLVGQELNGAVELVNYANHPESVGIEGESALSVTPLGGMVAAPMITDCTFWPGMKLDNPIVLPGNGGRIKLNVGNKLPIPFKVYHDDTYELTWGGRIQVQETKGVDCYYLSSNSVNVNVTAPAYENTKLDLTTDKESYSKNEPVKFTIYVENSSDNPINITLDEIMIHIRDSNGKTVLWLTAGLSPIASGSDARIPSVTISPHSKYFFKNISVENLGSSFWDWDQRNVTSEGMPVPMEPGTYQVYATFTSPPMKSDAVTIVLP